MLVPVPWKLSLSVYRNDIESTQVSHVGTGTLEVVTFCLYERHWIYSSFPCWYRYPGSCDFLLIGTTLNLLKFPMLVPVPWKLWLSVYMNDIESTQVSHVGTGTLEVVTFCLYERHWIYSSFPCWYRYPGRCDFLFIWTTLNLLKFPMLVPVPWKMWLSVYRNDIESTQVSHVGTGTLEVVTFCLYERHWIYSSFPCWYRYPGSCDFLFIGTTLNLLKFPMLVPVPWKLWLSVYRNDIESTQVSHVGTGTLEVVTFCL